MIVRIKKAVLAISFAVLVVCAGSPSAQATNSNSASVQGFSGQVIISPNPNLQQVVVVLNSTVPISSTSNQIVFVLEGSFSEYPTRWTGSARVLLSRGVVVVVPQTEGDSMQPLAFEFPDQQLPDSIKGWNLTAFPVYGIARYGETEPLTEGQISELETTGKYLSAAALSFNTNSSQSDSTQFNSLTGTAQPDYLCAAGGPGSTGCSEGGCSVSCSKGFYSCCSGGGCNCVPN